MLLVLAVVWGGFTIVSHAVYHRSNMATKNRIYYEAYSLPRTEEVPEGYKELSMIRPDGAFEAPTTVSSVCRRARKVTPDLG